MKYKLVAIDCDNTLLDSKGYITKQNKDVIKLLCQKGVKFIIATGRSDILAKDYLEELELDTPVISCNGAALTNMHTGEIIYTNPIDKKAMEKIYNYCAENSVLFKVFTTDCCYTNDPEAMEKGISQIVTLYERKLKYSIEYRFAKDMSVAKEKDILKAVIINDDIELLTKHKNFLKNIENLNVHHSGFNCIDMVSANATKGKALEKYAQTLGIRPEEVIAFGDTENDLSMLEFAGMGVAMENGSQGLKEKADYVTDTNDNSGVAKALMKFFDCTV